LLREQIDNNTPLTTQFKFDTDNTTLIIPTIILYPYLGVPEAERSCPQPVHVGISLEFLEELSGCHSDKIEETFCYHTLRDTLVDNLKLKQYSLIEHLTQVIGEVVLEQVKSKGLGKVKCRVVMHKVILPLVEMSHGVLFSKVFLS